MLLKFSKMHGLGNDYVVVDETKKPTGLAKRPKAIARICRRSFGVGSDGILFVLKSGKADFRMRMFNPDGSEAEMCGNGIRCFGKFVYDKKLTRKKELTVETLGGTKKLELRVGAGGKVKSVAVDMGAPVLERAKIPVAGKGRNCLEETIAVRGANFDFTGVSMGNPHAVVFTNDERMLSHEFVSKFGPLIERHGLFPRRTNVEFVKALPPTEARMTVWERGAGITAACGTGTCATVVAGVLLGKFAAGKWVTVHLDGGDLKIRVDAGLSKVEMDGPTEWVFDGVMEI